MDKYAKKIFTYAITATIISYSLFINQAPSAQSKEMPPSINRGYQTSIIGNSLPMAKNKMNITAYSQFDPRWKDKKLSPSSLTMGQFGCYITSFAMMIKNFAIADDPGQVLDKLIAVNGLNSDGILTYDGVMRAYPQVYFFERGYTTNDPSGNFQKTDIDVAIEKIMRRVRLGQPTMLAVDNAGGDGIPDHAVLLIDDSWTILNPDGGKIEKFQDKYGDPRKKLYGWISLFGPPINFPENGDSRGGQVVYKLAQANKGINIGLNVKQALDIFVG